MNESYEIEGSKARAEMRGADMFAPLGDRVPLNSVSVVDTILRQFIGEVVSVRADYNADKISGPEAGAMVSGLAGKYAAIFMGNTRDYATLPWNTPEQLGAFVLAKLTEPATADDAAEKYLARMAANFINTICIPVECEQINDETAQFRIAVIVEDGTCDLLGICNSASDDE